MCVVDHGTNLEGSWKTKLIKVEKVPKYKVETKTHHKVNLVSLSGWTSNRPTKNEKKGNYQMAFCLIYMSHFSYC